MATVIFKVIGHDSEGLSNSMVLTLVSHITFMDQ